MSSQGSPAPSESNLKPKLILPHGIPPPASSTAPSTPIPNSPQIMQALVLSAAILAQKQERQAQATSSGDTSACGTPPLSPITPAAQLLHPLALALLSRQFQANNPLSSPLAAASPSVTAQAASSLPKVPNTPLSPTTNMTQAILNAITPGTAQILLRHLTSRNSSAINGSHGVMSPTLSSPPMSPVPSSPDLSLLKRKRYLAPTSSHQLKKKLKLHGQFLRNLSLALSDSMANGRRPMSKEELEQALITLETLDSSTIKQPELLARIRRKLILRLQKLELEMVPFDLDERLRSYFQQKGPLKLLDYSELEQRYQKEISIERGENLVHIGQEFLKIPSHLDNIPLKEKLYGDEDMKHCLTSPKRRFISAFTGKTLPAFIFRDMHCRPHKVQLLTEIRSFGRLYRPHLLADIDHHGKDVSHPKSIDYVYFQRPHLDQVNELLCRNFWPGINVEPDLEFPDHGIIALYGRLVVGCCFMDTSTRHTHAYITYLAVHDQWRGAGIGTKLLYFALKSYERKDCLLHVSAMNAKAMCLYQKFGFKGEEFIVGFYDKYIHWKEGERRTKGTEQNQNGWKSVSGGWNTRGSRNAFYMRLRR